ncbi:hypothetical protein BDR03DRAFT_979454 [Suillus americanus]|nr:hypothetical protein BDR03DRAFT_979454 [Suillus americanus]
MVHTRPTNVSKRPAQVVLDTKQKRWTAAQVREDKAHTEREWQEEEQKAKYAITQVAAAQQKAAIQQQNAVSTKKPRPHPTGKGTTAAASSSHTKIADDNEDNDSQAPGRRNAACSKGANPSTCIRREWKQADAPLHLETGSSLSRPTGSALSQVTHATTNATTTATAPPVTPENSVFSDDVEVEDHTPDEDDGPERLAAYTLANMGKTIHAKKSMVATFLRGNMIEVEDISQPPTPPIPSQVRLLQYGLGGSHPPIAQPEPVDLAVNFGDQEDSVIFPDDADDSGAEDHDAGAAMRSTGGNKRVMALTNMEVVDNTPPSKHVKREAEGDVTVGEALKTKYKNGDLPPGCLDSNLWHGVFIPTVAHAAGGKNVHPWLIEDDILIPILAKAWNVVYADNPSLLNHKIIPGGAVVETIFTVAWDGQNFLSNCCTYTIYHMAKQRLSEWCRGFGSAAIMIITSLMASDTAYETDQEHIEFAKFWLEDNCFLFSDVSSDDPEAWTGMWQSTFMLQTFAAHLNYTQGRVEVPALNSDDKIMRASLALLAGAVKRALYLLSIGAMSFTITVATGKGKKKATNTTCKGKASASNGDIWEAIIGENESFSEPLWGYDTCIFLQAIKNVPSTAMEGIIQQTQQYMKATPHGGRSKGADEFVEEEIDEEYITVPWMFTVAPPAFLTRRLVVFF